jgi:hypothetical protein
MTACTQSGIDHQRTSNCLRNFLPTVRKNFRQLFLHLLRATRIVGNLGVIGVDLLFEKNPGVLDYERCLVGIKDYRGCSYVLEDSKE